jgi:hypothetical protein
MQTPPFWQGLGVQSSMFVQTLGCPVQLQPASTVQVLEQPSLATVLPSSQVSGAVTMPSPHSAVMPPPVPPVPVVLLVVVLVVVPPPVPPVPVVAVVVVVPLMPPVPVVSPLDPLLIWPRST